MINFIKPSQAIAFASYESALERVISHVLWEDPDLDRHSFLVARHLEPTYCPPGEIPDDLTFIPTHGVDALATLLQETFANNCELPIRRMHTILILKKANAAVLAKLPEGKSDLVSLVSVDGSQLWHFLDYQAFFTVKHRIKDFDFRPYVGQDSSLMLPYIDAPFWSLQSELMNPDDSFSESDEAYFQKLIRGMEPFCNTPRMYFNREGYADAANLVIAEYCRWLSSHCEWRRFHSKQAPFSLTRSSEYMISKYTNLGQWMRSAQRVRSFDELIKAGRSEDEARNPKLESGGRIVFEQIYRYLHKQFGKANVPTGAFQELTLLLMRKIAGLDTKFASESLF